MSIDYVAMGKRIRQLRRQRDMTQAEAAKNVGICLSFYGHVERGTRVSSLETIAQIASVFEVSIDELVMGFGSVDGCSDSRFYR